MDASGTSEPEGTTPRRQEQAWGIRGVPHEVREKVNAAARRQRLPLGAYVARALEEAANRDLAEKPPAVVPDAVVVQLQAIAEKLDAHSEQLRVLQERRSQGPGVRLREAWRGLLVRLTPPP
jgi:hypothetical protein